MKPEIFQSNLPIFSIFSKVTVPQLVTLTAVFHANKNNLLLILGKIIREDKISSGITKEITKFERFVRKRKGSITLTTNMIY